MNIPTDDFSGSLYHLMIQTVVPRPIAWALTKNENGSFNLAPFSYFNGVAGDPPVLMMSSGYKANGERKDTWKNIEREKECVIHIPSVEHERDVTDCSFEFGEGDSEVEALGLELAFDSKTARLPRVKSCKIAFYCKHFATHLIGNKNQGLLLSEIEEFYIDDSIVEDVGGRIKVDAMKLNPLARLGGIDYADLGRVIPSPRATERPQKT